MVSNVCKIEKGSTNLSAIIKETEKVTGYNELDKENSLRLQLLATELTSLLPGIIENFDGIYWVENRENRYELHVSVDVQDMSMEKRAELIEISKSKKNAAAVGILGKIRAAFDAVLLSTPTSDCGTSVLNSDMMAPSFSVLDYPCSYVWSLNNYKIENAEEPEVKDDLEKTIIGKLADDVIVGVRGKQVYIVIIKTF